MYANNLEKREFLHELAKSNQGIKYAMKAKGIDLKTIAKCTKLSEQEIQEL